MTGRRVRLVAAAAILVSIAGAVAAGAYLSVRSEAEHEEGKAEPEFPTALGRHIEKLKEALPGNLGEPEEGPWSAAEAEFLARAYPADTISVAQMDAARTAFAKASKRPFKGQKPGNWAPIGPSQALYPFTELRTLRSYVPNAYLAGGRTTSIAVRQVNCSPGSCRAWITPAGGGVWRTNDLFASKVRWEYLGGPLGINAAGSVTLDPNDANENTIYVGTGEANVCGSGCVAGVGLYKSVNGGQTWTLLGKDDLGGKGIGSVAIKPGDSNTIYAATTTALRGYSSVCCSGVTRPIPGAEKWGLYKSTDGGASWTFIHNGSADAADCNGSLTEFNNGDVCSPRGVRNVALDPTDPDVVYASSFARGVWRSNDGGATWTQIKPSLNETILTTRPNIAVTTLPNGKTRMYVVEGHTGARVPAGGPVQYSRLFRSDDVRTGTPTFDDLTSSSVADPGWATFNICTGQCWYDSFVYTPKGHPDIVYAGGSYQYGETIANHRGVVLSTDGGETFTDMTSDGTDPVHPNALHPDQHSILTNPNNPLQFVETNDGGVMRSSGTLVDRASWCDDRGFVDTSASTAAQKLARCQQMLAAIPSRLDGINDGLSTLQFQSLSVSPHDPGELQGGTQDNGTWENFGQTKQWINTMIGDGGQSGFDVDDPAFRFHNFFDASPDVNFNNGEMADWIWIADPIFGQAGTQFYAPMISDPTVSRTLFIGTGRTVYRTTTAGLGEMTLEEANEHCNEWTGDFPEGVTCGDWAELGPTRLTHADWSDRAGGAVAAIERTVDDDSTAWAATTTGRLFVTTNVDAEDPADVSWDRIDTEDTPNRFVSSIYVDPEDGNHAWVSYSGFDVNTPDTTGHVFEVTYDPEAGSATFTDLSHDFGDQPVADLVRDDNTGDLYASTDFGVMRLADGAESWTVAAPGMPNVEVAGLTIVPSARVLYAATHGLSAWKLQLG